MAERLTARQIEKLEEGFKWGLKTMDCLAYAEVKSGIYKSACKSDPALAARMRQCRGYGMMMARKAILKAIESGNENLSKWYLDRNGSEETGKQESAPATVIRVKFAIPRPEKD